MTTEELKQKYRRHALGILAESWANRKLAINEFGLVVDRQILCFEELIQSLVNDVVRDPPKPLPTTPDKPPLTQTVKK